MNPNVNMANMNPMGGPVGGAPMPMMNNGGVNPQAAAAAAAAVRLQQANENQRSVLNTYIYEYFIRYEMYECARSLLSSDHQVNVHKDGSNRRRDENGNIVNGVDDPMDTDNKDELDSKLPDDLPPPKLPMPASDSSFLYEWFCLFWDIYNAQRTKGGNGTVNQYVSHTQQQSRLKQNQQQEMLRQMRPDMTQQQQYLMRNMQNGNMAAMNMNKGNLARTAMANNQNNPQMLLQQQQQQQQQQAKQNQMQPGMDPNRERPSSPASGENAPSPSKRQRIEGQPFNPNQAGVMMANGRPVQNMPGQPMVPNPNAQAQQMLMANGINPAALTAQQLHNFAQAPQGAQQKSIVAYSQNLQQHHGSQMPNKQMPNAGVPQNQGSPSMMQNAPELAAYYNTADIGGPNAMRPGANGAPNPPGAGSNHALQDYQMQLMLLEQQNKKRLMMARQEQDNIGAPAPGQPGAPGSQGPNGQPFPDTSPQAMRTGTSPNPTDQMKRTPQMNNSGIPSPVPEGGQSRGSPNNMTFMPHQVDPNMAPHFMQQAQMNGMRPPSSHPGQTFNGQLNPQMMAARQQAGQGNPQQQWQQGPNGQMIPQGVPQNQPVQGTPQQRAMPPPSAPAPGGNANSRTTASPQQAAAAPPTPNQTNKAGPKKKESKAAKDKRVAQKKSNQNLNNANAAAAENGGEADGAAPATPITPVNPGTFAKGGPNGAGQSSAAPATAPTAAPVPPPPSGIPQPPPDPNQNGMGMNFDSMVDFGGMDMGAPISTGDVLSEFDFDSFLHDGDGNTEPFDFNGPFSVMEGGEIGAD